MRGAAAYTEVESSMKRLPYHGTVVVAAAVVWMLIVGIGLGALHRYNLTPGDDAAAPGIWPIDSPLRRSSELPTLLVFAHPRCACTRATISELERLLGSLRERVSVVVLFFHPHGTPDSWSKTELWDSAARIPQVLVRLDEDGSEARRFHSETSGRTLLYDRAGKLSFEGGITAERGHVGDSVGRDALLALLRGQPPEQVQTPAFGCSLEGGKGRSQSACGRRPGERPCAPP
jgi:hypothetical protein